MSAVFLLLFVVGYLDMVARGSAVHPEPKERDPMSEAELMEHLAQKWQAHREEQQDGFETVTYEFEL